MADERGAGFFTEESVRSNRVLLIAGAAVLAVGGIIVAERWHASQEAPAMLAVALPEAKYGPADYEAELAAMDWRLELGRERVADGPDEWLRLESLARAELARFSITAVPAELVAAGETLAQARALAPKGSGPLLTSAEYAMSAHDLDAAESYLAIIDKMAVPPEDAARSEVMGIRGDIAFYRGDMERAARFYEQADVIMPTASTAVRRAILLRGQGRFDDAIAEIRKAARLDHTRIPRAMAAYAMQIGMIESARGRYEEAGKMFRQADKLFPGYWLTQLYLAEVEAVRGDLAEAIPAMERLARQTGDPQAMDAAALLNRAAGDEAASKAWSTRAAKEWRKRVALLPSAYRAHAFENELAFGDPARALVLARENAAKRPYGDAQVLVAEALLATDQPAEARKRLLAAERSGWRSAPLYARLSDAEAALGNEAAAEAAADKARALNPHIFGDETGRLWFGHG